MKRWLPLALIILLALAAWASGITDFITLETLKANRAQLLQQVSTHPLASVFVFTALYAATVALSLPIASILTLLGGFLFGSVLGTIIIVVAATIGATIIFLVARSALGQTLREKAGPLYNKVAEGMKHNAVSYMLFMRLVPIFPFFLVNIVPALFNVGLKPYVLTTLVGIIPGTFIYANLGRSLGTINNLADLANSSNLIAFTLLGLFALVPVIYKKIKK